MDGAPSGPETLADEARAALARGEIALLYQPIAETASPGRTVGFEALARWSHPTRGDLEPEDFMAAFADEALALEFGEAVLDAALGQMRAWIEAGADFGKIAVNLSPAQFRSGRLADDVLDRLAHWGVPPERLCVEVMETVDLGSAEVAEAMRALHVAGVHVALDDFGAGLATVAQLIAFPIDRLKLDLTFCQAETDRSAVRAVAVLAHGLGMQVVAEGVENAAQLDALREAGCDLAQGWWISHPIRAADVPAFFAR